MYTLPVFNVPCDVWSVTQDPLTDVPRIAALPCQLYVNPRAVNTFVPELVFDQIFAVVVRFPKGSDVREYDYLRIPVGSIYYYEVLEVERMHLGFTNEYFIAYANQLETDNPFPLSFVLMEDEFYVLLEDGLSKIQLQR
jgi:hypothetical protein